MLRQPEFARKGVKVVTTVGRDYPIREAVVWHVAIVAFS
jgi:hypothetical protein